MGTTETRGDVDFGGIACVVCSEGLPFVVKEFIAHLYYKIINYNCMYCWLGFNLTFESQHEAK